LFLQPSRRLIGQGVQTVGPARRVETSAIVRQPLQPISLQISSQQGAMTAIKWTTKLSAGNPAARTDALMRSSLSAVLCFIERAFIRYPRAQSQNIWRLSPPWGNDASGLVSSITKAQVMVDGKFRPQVHELGVDETGSRKLEISVDLGEPGDKAVQVSVAAVFML